MDACSISTSRRSMEAPGGCCVVNKRRIERLHVVLLSPSLDFTARVATQFAERGFTADIARDVDEAWPLLRSQGCDALVVDGRGASPLLLDLAAEARELAPSLSIAVVGAEAPSRLTHGTGLLLLEGDDDLIRLVDAVAEEVFAGRECRQSARLLRCVEDARHLGRPLGHAPMFCHALRSLDEAIERDAPIVLIGEPATGRRTLARYVHDVTTASVGAAGESSFCVVDTAVDATFLSTKRTIYVPELQRLGAACIAELGRLLEMERCPRIVMATSGEESELEERLFAGRKLSFVQVPPLRSRREDIAMLATAFLEDLAQDVPHQGFSLRAIALLQLWSWPGNLRELQQVVAAAWKLCGGRQIGRRCLIGPGGKLPASLQLKAQSLGSHVDTMIEAELHDILPFEAEERRILAHALAATKGNVSKAAEALEIGRATLYRKIRHYGLRTRRDA